MRPGRAAGRSARMAAVGFGWDFGSGGTEFVARSSLGGMGGLPCPRVRAVCAASPPRAGAGWAAIRGVTTRVPGAALKGHGNAV